MRGRCVYSGSSNRASVVLGLAVGAAVELDLETTDGSGGRGGCWDDATTATGRAEMSGIVGREKRRTMRRGERKVKSPKRNCIRDAKCVAIVLSLVCSARI